MRRVEITSADLKEVILRKIDCRPEPGASLSISWRTCNGCQADHRMGVVAVVEVEWLDEETP